MERQTTRRDSEARSRHRQTCETEARQRAARSIGRQHTHSGRYLLSHVDIDWTWWLVAHLDCCPVDVCPLSVQDGTSARVVLVVIHIWLYDSRLVRLVAPRRARGRPQ